MEDTKERTLRGMADFPIHQKPRFLKITGLITAGENFVFFCIFKLENSRNGCIFVLNKGVFQMGLTSSPIKRRQIINEIMESIRTGKLVSGERLAPVRDLAKHFNVSLSVVQNAMRELIGNGFIECRGHSGFYVCSSNPENPGGKAETVQKDTSGRVILYAVHHSDLVWRHSYEEYDAIREEQLLHLLELAKKHPRFNFAVEQTQIMRVFLEKHPETAKQFRQLHRNGRFELFGSFCIPDLNMVCGESIVRNLLDGSEYFRSLFGEDPAIACMSDAFGMCAQLPQILVKCGFRYLLPGRTPNLPDGIQQFSRPFHWHALDDSSILTAFGMASISHLGYECNVPLLRDHDFQLAHCLAGLPHLPGAVLAQYMTEEGLIREDLFWLLETVNRNAGRKIEFGSALEFFRLMENESLPAYHGEMNPVFSGCYSTRISVKQAIRKAENLLLAAETAAAFAGREHDWTAAWRGLFLTQFHDAICGCHTDAANAGIMEMIRNVSAEAGSLFKHGKKKPLRFVTFGTGAGMQLICSDTAPADVPVQEDGGKYYYQLSLPSCGVKSFRNVASGVKGKKCSARFKTDYFEADFSSPFPVIRTLNGENVFSSDHFGEILFRTDYGTMWSEQYTDWYHGHAEQKETVREIISGPVFFKAVTEGEVLPRKPEAGNLGDHWPGFGSLAFRKEYIFPKHFDHFRLKLTLFWKGRNTQISIRFPVDLAAHETAATYEVPFGCMVRKPYFEVKSEFEPSLKMLARQSDYTSARGNWPALNWVNYSDLRKGLTVANTGTPGHQLVNNEILVTLLRSGSSIKDGNMVPQEGSFENGTHEYEFAFRAHPPRDMEKAAELGRQLNSPPQITEMSMEDGDYLNWTAANILLSALCRTADGIQVRLYEAVGRQTTIDLKGKLLDGMDLFESDMAGREPVQRGKDSISFRPFEIKTFIIK